MKTIVKPINSLRGIIRIPGDKSISHRSAMLASLCAAPVRIENFSFAADCVSTVKCLRALGVKIEPAGDCGLTVEGNGLYGLRETRNILDAGNSGTLLRLLTGILGGQPFLSVLTGDESLIQRPMTRIIEPLRRMGCSIVGRGKDRYAPLAIAPRKERLCGIDYEIPVASAQVKSTLLFAGMFANGTVTLAEQVLTRDHSENLLPCFGVAVNRCGPWVKLEPVDRLLAPAGIEVPGDISSAAFWIVAASIIPGSWLWLRHVGVNPTRTGILDILDEMGANFLLADLRMAGKEPVADILVESAKLRGVTVEAGIIPRIIDEIPVLAVAALFAEGTTTISGAQELRVKETDRLKAITTELGKMGAIITEKADGLIIEGQHELVSATCDTHNDHRMAMSLAVAGMAAQGVELVDCECVNVSYPGFFTEVNQLRNSADIHCRMSRSKS